MPKSIIVSYQQALATSEGMHRYLLLGNGFSIAVKPDIFTYDSLFEKADFGGTSRILELFNALNTRDFEIVIRHLLDAARVVEVYRPKLERLKDRLRRDASAIKDALVQSVARGHPDRPFNIEPEKYAACRSFLQPFRHIFTLNYDVLLYWALMQSEVDDLNLHPDDGFRHPEDDPEEPYVSWQQVHSLTVHYLHGALHLFDSGTDIIKYTWSKTDVPIVEQIRTALDEDRYPLFVAEGHSSSKRQRILHNAYLHKALRSFEGCCNQTTAALVVFGHSLADNDRHILRCIERGRIPKLLVSIYGDQKLEVNETIIKRAKKLVSQRDTYRNRYPLDVVFFNSQSARVWG